MGVKNKKVSGSEMAEINIIPLVDIMLVLLVIFMVAAPLLQQGVDVNLPQASASNVQGKQEDFIVSITKDGRIFLGQEKNQSYSLANLKPKLEAIFLNKEKKEIYLRADSEVEYGYVVKIMALCQEAGISRVGMMTTPEQAPSS